MPNNFAGNFGLILLTVGSILILARELLISAVRQIAASKGIVVQANIFGKIKTVMQDVSLPLLLLMNAQSFLVDAEFYIESTARMRAFDVIWFVAVIVFGLAVIMTIVSGVIYLVQNRGVFKQKQSK